jgi:hypothetical protein
MRGTSQFPLYPEAGHTYTAVSGVGPVTLNTGQSSYTVTDETGSASDWYITQYYNTSTLAESGWSDPILGEVGDLFYNPLFPSEVSYGTSEQLIIDRIRRLIGDPVGLRREYGEDASSSIHPDGKTYELDEKGWPCSVYMNGVSYNTSENPTINGYRYLRFSDFIDVTTTSGVVDDGDVRTVTYGVDIWYYTHRHSDREIMEAYDNTPPPPPLSTTNTTSEIYMLTCAYDLLFSEFWEDTGEDGAKIGDEGSTYDPSVGIQNRRHMLDALRKRLDNAIKSVTLLGISGVLID